MLEDTNSLYSNVWCPLLGRLPFSGDLSYAPDTTRCYKVILKARKLWGVTCQSPYAQLKLEEKDEWKQEAAQAIAALYPYIQEKVWCFGTGNTFRFEGFAGHEEIIIKLVRDSIKLDERVTNNQILAIIAIGEAWDALEDILFYKATESSDIRGKVGDARKLLNRAGRMAS